MMGALRDTMRRAIGGKEEEFDNQDRELFEQARLGFEVRQQLGPILSEYIETQAQEDRIRALGRLEKVDPTDTAAIASLQVEAKAAAKALTWLADAVSRGKLAEEQLRKRDEEDQNNE